jgi:hypothetical protein
MDQEGSLHGKSKSNEMEAALVRLHAKQLVEAGVRPEAIAVVTPYNAQVCFLIVGSSIGATRLGLWVSGLLDYVPLY